jgi:multiple sugar transport system substrate-binding protein
MERLQRSRLTRRRVLGGVAGSSAALALGTGRLQAALAAKKAPAVLQGGGTFVYWGGLIFSEEANNMLVEEIGKWGEANGVETETVMINQNETNQKVSAAVESNTMPDALDMGLDLLLLLSNTGQLEPVDDVFAAIGDAHDGWFDSVANSAGPDLTGGVRTGVPFGSSGNMLFSRSDVLAEAGLTPPPATWQ